MLQVAIPASVRAKWKQFYLPLAIKGNFTIQTWHFSDIVQYYTCDLFWRNREQVVKHLCLILPVESTWQIYPMHSTRQNINNWPRTGTWSLTKHTQYCCCAFMIDSFYNSSSKVSLTYWNGVPQLLDSEDLIASDKISLYCWLVPKWATCDCEVTRADHIMQNKPIS